MSIYRHVQTLQRERALTWIHTPRPYIEATRVQIIGGNTVNGVDCILYAATAPTITSLLDPDVDTSYSNGFGRGWMMSAAGQGLRRVLLWHEFAGYASPMQGGYVADIRDTVTMTVASGPDAGEAMTFYRMTYPS